MTEYTIQHSNREKINVKVEVFKDATEAYVRKRIEEDIKYPIIIKQRLYRDGKWIFRIYTVHSPRTHGFHKRYDFFWDYEDIEEYLDKVIEDYIEWHKTNLAE